MTRASKPHAAKTSKRTRIAVWIDNDVLAILQGWKATSNIVPEFIRKAIRDAVQAQQGSAPTVTALLPAQPTAPRPASAATKVAVKPAKARKRNTVVIPPAIDASTYAEGVQSTDLAAAISKKESKQ